MLTQLLRFELRYQATQLAFYAASAIFFALGATAAFGNYGGSGVHANGPYAISVVTALLSFSAIFASIVFCANVVLRDVHHGTEQLIFIGSLTKRRYFISRFTGLFCVVMLLLVFSLAGLMLGSTFTGAHKQGPFNLLYFLQPLLVFGLPNVLLGCAVVFATAVFSRSAKAVYVAGVLMYVMYLLGSVLGNSPVMAGADETGSIFPSLLDPFGLAALFGETRRWTDEQLNTQLFPLQGAFLLNRIAWTGVSMLMLFTAYNVFSFRPHLAKPRKAAASKEKFIAVPYRSIRPVFKGYIFRSFLAQFRLETAAMLKNIPLVTMLLLWMVLMGVELNDMLFHGIFGSRVYPSTGIIVEALRASRPAMLLVIFCAAELVRRERAVNMHALVYTAPVKNMMFPAMQFAVLAVVIFVLVSLNILLGLGLQWSQGYFEPEIPVYLSLYYYSGLPLILFAMLALFIQTLVKQKYTGMLINLLVAGLIVFGKRFGLEDLLLRYAVSPDMKYSDMNGFGHYAKAFNWYMLYWAAFSAMLLFLSAALWKRTRRTGERMLLPVLPCLLIVIASGVFIYSKQDKGLSFEKWEAEYEKHFAQYAAMPQPDIISIRTQTDIYPAGSRYTVKGWYLLKNNTDEPVTKLLAGAHPEMTKLRFAGNATEAGYNQYWITLRKTLAPGDTMSLEFIAEADRSGFRDFNNEHSIVRNGSYVELEKYLPYFGFNTSLVLSDSIQRKAAGLRAVLPQSPATVRAPVDFETVISTDADQQAVSAGELIKEWREKGRNYFHYKAPAPIQPMFAFSSARYRVIKENHNGVDLRLYYHEGHETNIPAMMRGLRDALDYCSAQFGPYPQSSLSLAELPQYRGAATSYPGVLFAAERFNFKMDCRNPGKVNFAQATAAHEVSHQWWALQLVPADTLGSKFLTESLAKYTEAMVIEKSQGETQLLDYFAEDNKWYMYLRSFSGNELPLVRTDGEPHVAYQKGGLAMYRLKAALGEDRVNAVLRHAIAKKISRAEDLVKELSLNASPDEIGLINTCLKEVATYELSIKVTGCERVNGKYKLSLAITTLRNGGPANDLLPLSVIGQASQQAKPFYEEMILFKGKETKVTLLLDHKPYAAVIDRQAYIPDSDLRDNIALIR